jgi:phage-related protein
VLLKPAIFLEDSRERLRDFPAAARRRSGYQLDRVQHGFDPEDWKPMGTIGAGVREIRVRDNAGGFRVIYVATRPEAVYVLHCFEKKSQRTSRLDIALATKRYKDLVRGER